MATPAWISTRSILAISPSPGAESMSERVWMVSGGFGIVDGGLASGDCGFPAVANPVAPSVASLASSPEPPVPSPGVLGLSSPVLTTDDGPGGTP